MAGMDFEAAVVAAAGLRFSMIVTPGGTFRMGVDGHYREEAPACRITAGSVRIDAVPATGRPFKDVVRATRRVTFADIPPTTEDHPATLPHKPCAGSVAFYSSPRSVDLRDKHQGRQLLKRAVRPHPRGPKVNISSRHGPTARHTKPADTPTCRVGFRCVVRQQDIE